MRTKSNDILVHFVIEGSDRAQAFEDTVQQMQEREAKHKRKIAMLKQLLVDEKRRRARTRADYVRYKRKYYRTLKHCSYAVDEASYWRALARIRGRRR
jgi:hypothetical protein